jgi:hypothetical protein
VTPNVSEPAAPWRTCPGCGQLAALPPDAQCCEECDDHPARFRVGPADTCPTGTPGHAHVWRRDTASTDLPMPGTQNVGLRLLLGSCRWCGVGLAAIGRYGGAFPELPLWLELPDLTPGEE